VQKLLGFGLLVKQDHGAVLAADGNLTLQARVPAAIEDIDVNFALGGTSVGISVYENSAHQAAEHLSASFLTLRTSCIPLAPFEMSLQKVVGTKTFTTPSL
jgi:hypothetical protein